MNDKKADAPTPLAGTGIASTAELERKVVVGNSGGSVGHVLRECFRSRRFKRRKTLFARLIIQYLGRFFVMRSSYLLLCMSLFERNCSSHLSLSLGGKSKKD